MKTSDRQLLIRVAVGMALPPLIGAVLVAIAGWPFNAQARAMLAASSFGGGALVGGIQLWDRRRDADIQVEIPGLGDLQMGINNLTENLSELRPPTLPPMAPPHPEAPAIPVEGYTVPPTGPAPYRVDVPDPSPTRSRPLTGADLIADDSADSADFWHHNGSDSSYSSGFHR